MAAFFTIRVSPILALVKVNHEGLENYIVGSSSQSCREKAWSIFAEAANHGVL